MKTKIIEVSNGVNWGKFMLGQLEPHEWAARSQIEKSPLVFGLDDHPGVPLIQACGWTHKHVWVLDLQTGEGAWFKPGGSPTADLEKHAIWVCLLFEPFLEWLYDQDLTDLDALPALVELPDAPAGLYGHRRPGPQVRERALEVVKTRWWHSCEDGPGGCHAVSEQALTGLVESLGLPVDDIYDVAIHDGDSSDYDPPPPDHVPCPDCGDDAGDWSSHAEHCPRIGTIEQAGPPWGPPPWPLSLPHDFTKALDRDLWRGRVLGAVLGCMAGKLALSLAQLDEELDNYLQVVKDCVPASRIRDEFETISKDPVPA